MFKEWLDETEIRTEPVFLLMLNPWKFNELEGASFFRELQKLVEQQLKHSLPLLLCSDQWCRQPHHFVLGARYHSTAPSTVVGPSSLVLYMLNWIDFCVIIWHQRAAGDCSRLLLQSPLCEPFLLKPLEAGSVLAAVSVSRPASQPSGSQATCSSSLFQERPAWSFHPLGMGAYLLFILIFQNLSGVEMGKAKQE